MSWTQLLAVCLAGAAGSGLRYWIAVELPAVLGTGFPYATLLVNVSGSYLISLIMAIGLDAEWLSPFLRITLTTGLLGGFTTYSSFNFETLEYFRQGAWYLGALNLAGNLLGCLIAGILGLVSGHWLLALRA